MRPIVTLLTDFGTADGYVGEMKGVVLSHAPEAQLVDITHEIPPQDIEFGRLTLARVWRRFPPGTVHLAVVDPGVGSAREAIAASSEGQFLVGPDNGLLSPALLSSSARAVTLPVSPTASATFHGRDVFAPAAGKLAAGVALDALGPVAAEPIIRRMPEARRLADGSLQGCVIAVDRFGNLVTNLLGTRTGTIVVGGHKLPLRRTYADVEEGQPLALVGSSGLVEIAVRNGSAAAALGAARGDEVRLKPSP